MHWLEEYLAAGDLLLLDPSFRSAALLIDHLLLGWLVLVVACLRS